MTKFFFLIALALATNATFSQDIKDIQKYTLLGQTQKAKEAVDKYLEVPKNAAKPEGWYYKGYVYNQLSKDSTLKLDANGALKATAFEAIKKYRELDAKAPLLVEQNNSTLFDLYVGYYSDLGVKSYMAKDPAAAYDNFRKGLEIHDYIVANDLSGSNGFKFSPIDTTLTLYTAIAAIEAKKPDEAVKYYQKLVDADINEKEYIDAYQFLADYYKKAKNKEGFANVIAKGKKHYPKNNEYWSALEIEEATDGIENKPELFSKYDELLAKNTDNYALPYNYSVELYRFIYSDDLKDSAAAAIKYKEKLVETLKKAIAIQSSPEANFLMANFLYNNSIDISEEARKMKGTKPDDVKKKKELQAKSTADMNAAAPYAEEAVKLYAALPDAKTSEKVNHKQALVILKSIANENKDTAKAAEYDKKIKATE